MKKIVTTVLIILLSIPLIGQEREKSDYEKYREQKENEMELTVENDDVYFNPETDTIVKKKKVKKQKAETHVYINTFQYSRFFRPYDPFYSYYVYDPFFYDQYYYLYGYGYGWDPFWGFYPSNYWYSWNWRFHYYPYYQPYYWYRNYTYYQPYYSYRARPYNDKTQWPYYRNMTDRSTRPVAKTTVTPRQTRTVERPQTTTTRNRYVIQSENRNAIRQQSTRTARTYTPKYNVSRAPIRSRYNETGTRTRPSANKTVQRSGSNYNIERGTIRTPSSQSRSSSPTYSRPTSRSYSTPARSYSSPSRGSVSRSAPSSGSSSQSRSSGARSGASRR